MKKDKNLARPMALLVLAHNERDVGVGACPSPEDIAAVAEGLLSWERRYPVMRHLTVCSECYRIWLEVARPTADPPFALWRPPWSFRTLAYAGGALVAVVFLAVFLQLHRAKEEVVSSQPLPATMVIDESERSLSVGTTPYSLPPLKDGDVPGTADDAAQSDDSLPGAGDGANTRPQAASAKQDTNEAGTIPAIAAGAADDENKTEAESGAATGAFAGKENGNIRISVVERRRSADQLTVWYNDLRGMCSLPYFLPDQWSLLHVRGASILKAVSDNGQEDEIDRLWLMLGQMEGLTAERRKSFCAWSDKELARKREKERDKTKRR